MKAANKNANEGAGTLAEEPEVEEEEEDVVGASSGQAVQMDPSTSSSVPPAVGGADPSGTGDFFTHFAPDSTPWIS